MKRIYIVLTHTGTLLSKVIKMYTKDEFSHVSIALDIELKQMYSFGRVNPYNPIIGGFVHEYINKGTFKRFFKTKASIYSLEITNEQYQDIRNIIREFVNNKEKYKFNILGLFAAGFHKKISSEKSFYCAEFVKYVMDKAQIKIKLPETVKPDDFKKIENLEKLYSGLLRKYRKQKLRLSKEFKEHTFYLNKNVYSTEMY